MSIDSNGAPRPSRSPRRIARRDLLQQSVFGGAALAAMLAARVDVQAAGQQSTAPADGLTSGKIRRVVAGRNADGKSCVIRDELTPINDLWRTSTAERLGASAAGEPTGILKSTRPEIEPAGGSRFFIARIAPSADPKPNLENRRGFHTTATIDYIFVLTGEVKLLLDTQEVSLKTGDAVVLRNSSHSWRNDGDVPCHFLVGMVQVAG